MPHNIKLIVYLLLLLASFCMLPRFFHPLPAYAEVLFEDNFDDGNANNWNSNGNSIWHVQNGKYGGRINTPSTILNTIAGSISTPNYIIEYDITPISGVDKNIDFRWHGFVNNYGIHFNTTNGINYFAKEGLDQIGWPKPVDFGLENGETYHVKIVLNNQHIEVYIDDNKIVDEIDTEYHFTTNEQIGLRISTGSSYPTEVWFDNVKVSTLDTTLQVPYFSQNSLPWGPTEYDHAQMLGINDPTMDRWGCAVTSAAMILRFHNINEFENGTPIDPGSLNQWLKDNHGYLTGKNKNGEPYASLLFPAIGTLTNDLYIVGKAPIKLEYQRPKSDLTTVLTDDLTQNKFPDIIKVKNDQTSSHFVVATGKSDTTYTINDPEWDYHTLNSFGNSFTQLDRYIPSHTNLSYIVATTNPEVEYVIQDPNSHKSGKLYSNNVITTFDEIEEGFYQHEDPLSNPSPTSLLTLNENLGIGYNSFYLPKPINGKYQLTLSSKDTEFYTLNLATFKKDGVFIVKKYTGTVSPGNTDTIIFKYSQDGETISYKNVTFQSIIQDIKELRELHDISNPGLPIALINTIEHAEKTYDNNDYALTEKKLADFIEKVDEMMNHKQIDMDGYTILSDDIQSLQDTIAQ